MNFTLLILILMSILQWNCRGFKVNFNELSILNSQYNPQAICLQETHLKVTDNAAMRHFTLYNAFSPESERAKGGASILVRQGVIHSQVPLKSNLQAIAVRLTSFKTLTICSLYIPPSHRLCFQDLDELVQQLPKPYLLLGDFNSHNPLWGSNSTSDKGTKVEHFINQNNYHYLTMAQTHIYILLQEHIPQQIYL